MDIPARFMEKIVRTFGDKGREWLDRLPGIFESCVQRWELTECQPLEDLSVNYICFAKSPNHGQVVLKIGVPHPELFTESIVLRLFRGRHVCTCHDSDLGLGALLLERIIPGDNLASIPDQSERIRIAADMIRDLPIPLAEGVVGLPTYSTWISRAFSRARREKIVGQRMLTLIDAADSLFREVERSDCPQKVLHGDLHHWNVLMDSSGRWKAIDPKGVIGAAHLEAGRFIINQVGEVDDTDLYANLDEMTTVIGERLGQPRRTIAICGFVESVLATCWSFEDRDEPAHLSEGIRTCQMLCDYVRGIPE